MNFENNDALIETLEKVPSIEEIRIVLNEAIGSREFKEVKMLEDECGVFLMEVQVDGPAGIVEYGYMRKGRYGQNQTSTTSVHAVFYDNNGIPSGGCKFAELVDGTWQFNKDFKEL